MKKTVKVLGIIFLVLFTLAAVCGVILMEISYPAGEDALRALDSDDRVSVIKTDSYITFSSDSADTGFIFYPGGCVEYTAYAPLMRALAERNIFCILVKMPLNLGVLDMYAAEDIPEAFPDIENWYIGGHSLGGSSAAYHLEKTTDDFDGLVLLASYSTVDLHQRELKACSLWGTEDGVLNRERYQENLIHLPAGYAELVIDGGNHAYFGDYGHQKNDGTAAISGVEQISVTADYLAEFFQ